MDKENSFYAKDGNHWRQWLQEHHESADHVWLIIYKKDSGTPSVYYDEAVDEALCFGWIDSKPNKRDDESFYQYFSRRNPKSNWSRVNKDKIARLDKAGKIAAAGKKMIDHAKKTGTWDALNDVDALVIPPDMQTLFDQNKIAFENYEAFPPSTKRGILEWIFNAKRPATRERRIRETVELAAQNIRANQYHKK